MAGYLGSVPVPQATQHRESFTCTEGQTSFATAGYTAQFVDVYLNGSHLSPADFTATNGSDVVLAVAASADDVCDIISYTPFEIASPVFTGSATFNEGSADADFRVESNGNANMLFVDGGNNAVVIGHNDVVNIATISPSLQIEGTGFAGSAVGQYRYSADAFGPTILFASSRNASIAGQTILQNNDELGKLRFYGSDGNDFENYGAEIIAAVDGTPGSNDMPGRLVFSTTADGSAAATERMRIDSSGNVGIGTDGTLTNSTGFFTLTLNGSTGGQIAFHTGNSAKQYIYSSSTDLNIYNSAAGNLKFYTNGNNERMRIDSSGNVLVGTTDSSGNTAGHFFSPAGYQRGTRNGSIQILNRITTDGSIIDFQKDGSNVGGIGTWGGGFYVGSPSGADAYLYFGNTYVAPSTTSGFRDDAIDLGNASARFDDIYATNGTIQTSDRNEKQDIAALTSAEMLVAKRISPLFKTFRWKDKVAAKGDDARTHTGMIAQDVQAAFEAESLDAGDYSMFISTTWWEHSFDVDAVEADDTVEPAIEAADAYTHMDVYKTEDEAPSGSIKKTRLGIRYPELLSFLAAYNEQRFAAIETRLTALEG